MTRSVLLLLLCVAGCETVVAPDDAAPRVVPPLYVCPVCADPREGPLPEGSDGHRCVAMGASEAPTPARLEDVVGALPGPARVVDASAPPGGDGSEARPFDTVEHALAAGAATLSLRAGVHRVARTVVLPATAVIVGAGVTATTITAPPGVSVLRAAGADARVTLARITVLPDAATGVGEAAVDAREGAQLRVRDVVIRGAYVGLRAADTGTALDARGLTVASSTLDAAQVVDGARAAVSNAWLRASGRHGIRAGADRTMTSGRVHLASSRVDGARGYGVALSGDAADGGFGDCAGGDPLSRGGARDCVLDVSVQGVTGIGVGVFGARDVDASRILVACTREDPAQAGSGYGVYATRGAALSLDVALAAGPSSLSRGSQVIANARAGVVVERDSGEPAARDTVLAMRGALVASNGGPGVIVQRGATATEISYARVVDNAGLGLGLTEGTRVGEILCDQFVDTRPATLQTTAGPYTVGDGMSIYAATVDRVAENDLSRNGRFGAVLGQAAARLTNNRGADNLYGVGNYDPRAVSLDATNVITGRAASPTAAPPITR